MKDAFFGHLLLLVPGLGQGRLLTILRIFGGFQNFWSARPRDVSRSRLPAKILASFLQTRPSISLDKEELILKKHSIELVSFVDADYPPLLKEIPDAPALLYIRGNRELFKRISLGMVGARKMSTYGQLVSRRLVSRLQGFPLVLTSGLALGVDGMIHRLALDDGLPTIAVLGSGLADAAIYPYSHLPLAHRILTASGLLASEYPPLTRAHPPFFPARNRIIAGLSQGVVVIEAAEKSGALITAYQALDYNRLVMAVPGNIFQVQSVGTNGLIHRGAIAVRDGQDIIDALQLDPSLAKFSQIQCNSEERHILKLLNLPSSLDQLIENSGLSVATVTAIITKLELHGLIFSPSTHFFVKK